MYTIYLHDGGNLQFMRFDSIKAAETFYNTLTVAAHVLVTIESSKLEEPIVLKRSTKTLQLKINPTV